MTEPKPIVAPVIVPHEDSVLFLAQYMAGAKRGDIEIEVHISGLLLEAEVRRIDPLNPSEILLTERLNLEPTLQAWFTDLLNRAKEESTS